MEEPLAEDAPAEAPAEEAPAEEAPAVEAPAEEAPAVEAPAEEAPAAEAPAEEAPPAEEVPVEKLLAEEPAGDGVIAAGTVLLAEASVWSYLYEGEAPAPEWKDVDFDATSWPTGEALLGWGRSDLATEVTTNLSPRPGSIYLRATFEIPAGQLPAGGITLVTRADDGIIVFMNGVEVGRSNLVEEGEIGHDSYALSSQTAADVEANPVTIDVPASALVEGLNVIAAQVVSNHRNAPTVSFDLSATVK